MTIEIGPLPMEEAIAKFRLAIELDLNVVESRYDVTFFHLGELRRHPDDIEFGCAGTAAKWAKYGCEVTYVLLTSGNVGTHDPEMTREKLVR